MKFFCVYNEKIHCESYLAYSYAIYQDKYYWVKSELISKVDARKGRVTRRKYVDRMDTFQPGCHGNRIL
jgi:hypothetical protein